MKTPVALIIFNRPDLTARVFERIALYKPERLLVIADGPRHAGDEEKCRRARSIIDRVDWDCKLFTNYSEVNLGTGRRVSSGLDWVFTICEEAIILEDDCVPHLSFFQYCEELLERYRHDGRVFSISGNNFQDGITRSSYSYYFSLYPHCWGWATWRRAWIEDDQKMKSWPAMRDGTWLEDVTGNGEVASYWRSIFDRMHAGEIDAWDYPWTYSSWLRHGLTVLPEVNLVSNIGFGKEATHTTSGRSPTREPPAAGIRFPLRHPEKLSRDTQADLYSFHHHFAPGVESPAAKRWVDRLKNPLALMRTIYRRGRQWSRD